MFKRQFYALEHANRGDSDSSSSSSSSSLDSAHDGDGGPDVEDSGSSRQSHGSSEDEVEASEVEVEKDASPEHSPPHALDDSEEGEDGEAADNTIDVERRRRKVANQWAEAVEENQAEGNVEAFGDSVVVSVGASNRVLKCRWCPKVICLSEESIKAHLSSKGHARSLKHLAEGKLKVRLDSDGEEEEEGETHAERFARTVTTLHEEKITKRKHNTGRQRQRKRLKRKALLAEKDRKLEALQVPPGRNDWELTLSKDKQRRSRSLKKPPKDASKAKSSKVGRPLLKPKREKLANGVGSERAPGAKQKRRKL